MSVPKILYHGSPHKIKVIKRYQSDLVKDDVVFLTPYLGLAACFIPDKQSIIDKYPPAYNWNFGFELWNASEAEKSKLSNKIIIYHNLRGAKSVSGISKGYIYEINTDKYNSNIQPLNNQDDNEYIYSGSADINFTKCTPVTIEWTAVFNELQTKSHGEAKLKANHNLFTYVPMDNTLEKDGLLSTMYASDKQIQKYAERAGSDKRKDIIDWLEKSFPGRSRGISCFTEEIARNAPLVMQRFGTTHVLCKIDSYESLLERGLAEACYKTRTGTKRGCDKVEAPDYTSINWNVKTEPFLFSNIAHYIIVLTKGKLSAKYFTSSMPVQAWVNKVEAESIKRAEVFAHTHYEDNASHGWNHIACNLDKAKHMVAPRKLTAVETTAIMYHDSALRTMGREHHEDNARIFIMKDLKGIFTYQELEYMSEACAQHRGSYKGELTSDLADLVSSSDRSAPNITHVVLRSYAYNKEMGKTDEDAYIEVARHLKNKYGKNGYAKLPRYYCTYFKGELAEFQHACETITPELVKSIIETNRDKINAIAENLVYANINKLEAKWLSMYAITFEANKPEDTQKPKSDKPGPGLIEAAKPEPSENDLTITPSGVKCNVNISVDKYLGVYCWQINSTGRSDLDFRLSEVGKSITHSSQPNCDLIEDNKVWYLHTHVALKANDLVTIDLNTVPWMDNPDQQIDFGNTATAESLVSTMFGSLKTYKARAYFPVTNEEVVSKAIDVNNLKSLINSNHKIPVFVTIFGLGRFLVDNHLEDKYKYYVELELADKNLSQYEFSSSKLLTKLSTYEAVRDRDAKYFMIQVATIHESIKFNNYTPISLDKAYRVEHFAQQMEAGDVLTTYPSVNAVGVIYSYGSMVNRLIQHSVFSSCKCVLDDDYVAGYGVDVLTCDLRKVNKRWFIHNCGGILVLRHKQMTSAAALKIKQYIEARYRLNIPYSPKAIMRALYLRHYNINEHDTDKLSKKELDKYTEPMFCSSIMAYALKSAGLELKFDRDVDIRYVFPIDMALSSSFRKVAQYGETEKDLKAVKSVESLELPFDVLPEIQYTSEQYDLEACLEAAGNKSAIKKRIVEYVTKVFMLMEPDGTNAKRFTAMLNSMSDAQFDAYMRSLRDKSTQLAFYAPNMKNNITIDNLINACHKLDIEICQHVWLRDHSTGRKFLTPNKHLILQIPIRRQEQTIDKKLGLPDNDVTINAMTGQVTQDDRANSITNPEIQMLYARGLMTTLAEIVQVRGGNVNAYAEFKRQLEETGSCDMNSIDPNFASRATRVAAVLFQSMHIDINL